MSARRDTFASGAFAGPRRVIRKTKGVRAARVATGQFYNASLAEQRAAYLMLIQDASLSVTNLAQHVRKLCGAPPYGFLLPGDPVLPQPPTPQLRQNRSPANDRQFYAMHRPYNKWGIPEFHDQNGFQYRRDPDQGELWMNMNSLEVFLVRHKRVSPGSVSKSKRSLQSTLSVGELNESHVVLSPDDVILLWDASVPRAKFAQVKPSHRLRIAYSEFQSNVLKRSAKSNRNTGIVAGNLFKL